VLPGVHQRTLLDDAVAARMRELGNVTPLISIEGVGEAGDERRGGRDVFGARDWRRSTYAAGIG
jgi:MoaA/NifB/PqqE/SkfB family radical SAM enzyme